MLRKGYIEQQVKALGQVLARLLKVTEEAGAAAALTEANAAGRSLAGMNLDTLAGLPEPTLLALFTAHDGAFDAGKCLVTAALLAEQSDLRAALGQIEASHVSRHKALLLLAHALVREERLRAHPTVHEIAGGLLDKMGGDAVSDGLWGIHAARIHESIGAFGKAEDALLALQDNGFPGAAREARAFYGRLLRLPDDELARGGLPRDEVEEGLTALGPLSPPDGGGPIRHTP